MNEDDFIDSLFDGKAAKATDKQLQIIETLLPYTSLDLQMRSEIINNLENMTEIEAESLLQFIDEHRVYLDPQDEYKNLHRMGHLTVNIYRTMAKGFVYMVWNGQHFIGEIDNHNLKKLLTEEEYSKAANNTKTRIFARFR